MKSKQIQKFKETEIGKIPEEWDVKKISSLDSSKTCVQTGPFGSLLHAHDYQKDGHPLILVKHVKDGQINEKDLPRIGDIKYSQVSKFTLREGDIIFTRVGYVGDTAYIEKKHNGWLFSGQTLRIRIDNPSINNKFVSYFFLTKIFKNIASSVVLGSTRDSINTQILKDIPIPIPPREEQDKITAIISSLIKQIQILKEQNKILEQITQIIFKSKFIDFDGITKFENSELGEIPKGWKIKKLEEIVSRKKFSIVDGPFGTQLHSDEYVREGIPVIKVQNLSFNGTFVEEKYSYISEKKFQSLIRSAVYPGDILLAKTGNTIGKFSMLPSHIKKGLIASSVLKISPDFEKFNNYYIYNIIQNLTKNNYWESISSGSTRPTIVLNDIKNILISYSDEIMKEYFSIVDPVYKKIEKNIAKSILLKNIRDALLPKLMSGEIRV